MNPTNKTVLDTLLSHHAVICQTQPITVSANELVHVVGAQEPVRDQPDGRARTLLDAGWLTVENTQVALPVDERAPHVANIQNAARTWLEHATDTTESAEREQVCWIVKKTRQHESKQQIVQRVWLALVLYSLGYRGLTFNSDGQILWETGGTGRIGIAPDDLLELAWTQYNKQIYAASFRDSNGIIMRGKGRQRWNIYRLVIDPAVAPLFERHIQPVKEKVALIVASEIHATQPQLPRDFYGGDAFQQACIDAQDQSFDHIFVLSPAHGIISLDDVVPAEDSWEDVMERRIWGWQLSTKQRLGAYLFGESRPTVPQPQPTTPLKQGVNWWAWLNSESSYEFTIFGGGFAVRMLLDYLMQMRSYAPRGWPEISIVEKRPGYEIGGVDETFGFNVGIDDEIDDNFDFEAALQEIDRLLEWSTEFVSLINVFVPPTQEVWDLAPDEALIPVRLLSETGMDIEDMLDLLVDMTLLLEQPVPISLLINAGMIVTVLLQIIHSLVHNEQDAVQDMLTAFPEDVLRQYIEHALLEPTLEERLCACLTLAEQMQLITYTISPAIREQLLIWLQTYIAARMRQHLLGDADTPSP